MLRVDLVETGGWASLALVLLLKLDMKSGPAASSTAESEIFRFRTVLVDFEGTVEVLSLATEEALGLIGFTSPAAEVVTGPVRRFTRFLLPGPMSLVPEGISALRSDAEENSWFGGASSINAPTSAASS